MVRGTFPLVRAWRPTVADSLVIALGFLGRAFSVSVCLGLFRRLPIVFWVCFGLPLFQTVWLLLLLGWFCSCFGWVSSFCWVNQRFVSGLGFKPGFFTRVSSGCTCIGNRGCLLLAGSRVAGQRFSAHPLRINRWAKPPAHPTVLEAFVLFVSAACACMRDCCSGFSVRFCFSVAFVAGVVGKQVVYFWGGVKFSGLDV